jgi:transcriptional regulator with XRE-family HTH domain
VGRRNTNPTEPKTNLARQRLKAGLTQHEVSIYTGISIRHYRRLESGETEITVPELANCAVFFGVKIENLVEKNWREWKQLHYWTPAAPSKETLRDLGKQRGRWD